MPCTGDASERAAAAAAARSHFTAVMNGHLQVRWAGASKDCKVSKVNGVWQLATRLTATGTHMPYGITQYYLPPGRGDIPAVVVLLRTRTRIFGQGMDRTEVD